MNRLSIAATAALLVVPVLAAHGTPVSRHGTLHVTAQFTKSSSFSTPVRCTASANPSDQSAGTTTEIVSSLGEKLTFAGNPAVGSCDILLSYNFNNIDSTTGLTVAIQVSTDVQAGFSGGNLATNEKGMTRSWTLSIGVPANGKTAVDFGDLLL